MSFSGDNNSFRQLALCVVPKFRKAAQECIERSKKRPEPCRFYQQLNAILVDLEATLKLQQCATRFKPSTPDLLQQGLTDLLSCLEDIANVYAMADGQPYPQLRSLIAQEATEKNYLSGLRQLRHKREKNNRDNYSKRLDNSLSLLKDLAARESLSPEPRDMRLQFTGELKTTGTGVSFVSEAETIHQALAQRWYCSCWARHEVGLRLATCHPSNHASDSLEFEVLFFTSRCRWQRGQISIKKGSHDIVCAPQDSILLSPASSIKSSPTTMASRTRSRAGNTKPASSFSLPLSKKQKIEEDIFQMHSPSATLREHSEDENVPDNDLNEGGLCRLVLEAQATSGSLVYLQTKKTRTGTALSGQVMKRYEQKISSIHTLGDIISSGSKPGENDQKPRLFTLGMDNMQKVFLAVVLAYSIMQLYGSPWTYRRWTKDRLYFVIHENKAETLETILHLHLSSGLDEPVRDASTQHELGRKQTFLRSQNPYQPLFDLGILLLEIELGKSIEDPVPNNSSNNDQPRDIMTLDQAKESVLSNFTVFADYRKAIKACLKKTPDHPVGDIEFVRQMIQEEIIRPLEKLLLDMWQIEILADKVLVNGQPIQRLTGPEVRLPIPDSPREVGRFLDCDRNHDLPDYDPVCQKVDQWFESVKHEVDTLLNQKTKNSPVKIAILDTGINAKRVTFPTPRIVTTDKTFGNCIKEYRSWPDGCSDGCVLEEMEDQHGHGTHAAGLLRRLAPRAELYVAQITKSGKDFEPDAQSVAWAIKYATEQWKVDIITMSFGFPDPIPEISTAIKTASEKKVIMFAAASNDGRTKRVAFPARLDEVIAIRSATPYGRRSEFNPDLPQTKNRIYHNEFMAIGENVSSSWPPCPTCPGCSGDKRLRRQSGTSVATPIAAGIAATILEYVQRELSEIEESELWKVELWQELRHKSEGKGIRKVLALMSLNPSQKLSFIDPNIVLSNTKKGKPLRKIKRCLLKD